MKLGSRLTLVGGKGGVGKTTTAAALAVRLADEGRDVLVLSVDPAHSLGDALGVQLGPDPRPISSVAHLSALEIDPELERRRFLDGNRGSLLALLERGTYLDSADAAGLVDLTLPGMDELAALFRLHSLLSASQTHLVVDTAPTGHTLRLLDLPAVARDWLRTLQAMEDRHRAVRTALVGSYQRDEVWRLLNDIDADLAGIAALLSDPERARFVLVTGVEPVILAETLRYQDALARRSIAIAGVVVNRTGERESAGDEQEAEEMIFVPRLEREPVGIEGLRVFAGFLFGDSSPMAVEPVREAASLSVGPTFVPPSEAGLYLVGGKGGVGKSTAAAALALQLAAGGRQVLLLSADPAGSLAEVLDQEVGAEATPVQGAQRLWARQLDAGAVWADFRSRYRNETERIFGNLLSGGMSTGGDQQVIERLVDLAPSGIDELVALMEVVDATEDRPYDAVVLDSAPTGHFIRLLELPDVALEWTHQMMRLLLKYREVVAPGDLGERLLELARSLHRFQELLRDPRSTWTLVVALPERLSVPETGRLLRRLRELGISPAALLVNRLLDNTNVSEPFAALAAEVAGMGEGMEVAAAPAVATGPRGIEPLVAFASGWRRLYTSPVVLSRG